MMAGRCLTRQPVTPAPYSDPDAIPMKAYVITTGSLFALITLVHVWRVIAEGPQLLTNPWWVLTTGLSTGLAIWAWRVLRLATRS
jgi:hypothetical protein